MKDKVSWVGRRALQKSAMLQVVSCETTRVAVLKKNTNKRIGGFIFLLSSTQLV